MGTLFFDLQDGFSKDYLRIRANGKQVYDQRSVSTQTWLGLAARANFPVERGLRRVRLPFFPSRTNQAGVWKLDEVTFRLDLNHSEPAN